MQTEASAMRANILRTATDISRDLGVDAMTVGAVVSYIQRKGTDLRKEPYSTELESGRFAKRYYTREAEAMIVDNLSAYIEERIAQWRSR